MKKKLDETYLPDKETRKSRLVVGLSGGLNSSVAAYLLKIQKYDLIGVTVAINWESFKGDASKILSCHLDAARLESIKEFCHQLGIPHVVIKASDEFKDEVVENWMASRVAGSKSNQCWNCHELRMRLLHAKMIEMDAQGMATGHLAKLFHQESHQSVYVHSSNDEINDQSGILSRLPHDILDKLMLPLSDLQQKEITKLAENFGVLEGSAKIKMHECFNNSTLEAEYLSANVPKKYLKSGDLMGLDKNQIGEHQGIQHHKFGEVYPIANQRHNEQLYFTKYSFSEKKIELSRQEYFVHKEFFLKNCKFSEETSLLEPIKGVVKINETEYAECWIHPKNLSAALIELEAPQRIFEGDIVTILKKKGKNSKVYLTGVVKYIAEEKSNIDEGRERVKVDYNCDY